LARLNIKQIEAFIQVAEQASFRGAAKVLNTTQPNISARISNLEAQLGRKLMERDAGSVRLTQAGTVLLEKARGVIDALDNLIVSADASNLFEGTLRLGVTETLVHSWLADYITALRERFPNIVADITVDLSSNLSSGLFNHSIDLALQSGPFTRQISGSIELDSYPMIWVAAPELKVGDDKLTIDDMVKYPIITPARQTMPFQQLESHFAKNPKTRLLPSSHLAACIQITLKGLGVACLPDTMVQASLKTGELIQLNYPWAPQNLSFEARYHADRAPYHLREAAKLAGEISHKFRS